MKDPCNDCVFHRVWGDISIGDNRYCTHPLVYKTPVMCPTVMNYRVRDVLGRVEE